MTKHLHATFKLSFTLFFCGRSFSEKILELKAEVDILTNMGMFSKSFILLN